MWAQGEAFSKCIVQLNKLIEKGVYVIGCLREVAVFDDEIRFNDEEIESKIQKDMSLMSDEEKK